MEAPAVLRLIGIVKTFPGVTALDGVSLEVKAGEVHALLGENGAGKSTLMTIAAGALAADAGTIEIDGKKLEQATPSAAQRLGLGVVYQHTSVLADLTVAENLLYCVPRVRRPEGVRESAWIGEQLGAVGAVFDKRTRVSDLGVAERQLVEIAKALAQRPRVLVLDEPTEALTAAETEHLFARIDAIKAGGTAVVYISHRLPEVRRIADRITILRDGRFRGTFAAANISEREILALIIGRSIERAFPEKGKVDRSAVPAMVVRNLANSVLQGIDLELRPGEVVGLAGVEGNGQREFLRGLAGLSTVSGEISVGPAPVRCSDPVAAQTAGIVYLPGDRHSEGLFLSLSVRENLAAIVLDRLSRLGFVSSRLEKKLVDGQMKALAVKAPSAEARIATLSGGNQQKVLFARSLAKEPAVLLADEPTRGVDAGARVELYRVIRDAASSGAGVVVLSSDAVELQGLCDRVLVFSRGSVVRTLKDDEITEESITGAAIGADTARHRSAAKGGDRAASLRRLLSGDYSPTLVLVALIVALGLYTASVNGKFLSERSISSLLFLASALAFVSMGQLVVLLTGGIDLSVGSMTALVVVVLSFFAGENQGASQLALGLVLAFGTAGLVGVINGVLIRGIGLSSVITTISTFIALQGVALLLRSTPDGYYSSSVTDALTAQIGPIPIAFIVAVGVVAISEVILRRSRFGMELRAVGSNEVAAYRLGARVNRTIILAYVLCSLFAGVGGLLLAGQVGVGDPSVGQNYTLQSISAVVLGGASIFGGRGSFLGALAGVLLIQEITSATGFLGLGTAWQYWLPGGLILLAAGTYSRVRAGGRGG